MEEKLPQQAVVNTLFGSVFGNVVQNFGASQPSPQSATPRAEESVVVVESDEELFHFIHPNVGADDEVGVHNEVKRLVRRYGIQEICGYLSAMADQHKVLLPVSVQTAYDELVRMGMPSGEKGFDYKTFAKYYRK